MINKSYIKGFIPVIIICLAMLAAGSVFDWQITNALYHPDNPLVIVIESVAKFPVYAYLPLFGACMVVRNRNSALIFGVGVILMLSAWSIMFYFCFTDLCEAGLVRRANPYIAGILGGRASRITFLIIRRTDKNTIRKIQTVCAVAFLMMCGYIFGIGGLKVICGRDRYTDIITGGEYVFTPWYKPDFLSGGTSFPSGHTAGAMCLLTLLILPFVFEKFRDKKKILFLITYITAFVVALTRLVAGRHFLSDTAAAILCMTIWFMILSKFYESFYRRELLEKPHIDVKKRRKNRKKKKTAKKVPAARQ